jgi:hypothetical protein
VNALVGRLMLFLTSMNAIAAGDTAYADDPLKALR